MKMNIGIGHVNIAHLTDKRHYIADLITHHKLDIVGVTETRLLKEKHGNASVILSGFQFFRRDAEYSLHTGIGVYVHDSFVNHCVKRKRDLEPRSIECIWLELRPYQQLPILVGFIYRNGKSNATWDDDFIQMMTKVNSLRRRVVLMGDFNIDLMVPQPEWISCTKMVDFTQLITEPTRIQKYTSKKTNRSWVTSTLIDHIYTNNTDMISASSTSNVCVSDHKPLICKLTCKLPKRKNKGHTYVQYRCFKKFDQSHFISDLLSTNFSQINDCPDANIAASKWLSLFLTVINKHLPLRRRRVKNSTFPEWMTIEIRQAMRVRDDFKKNKLFAEYKKERNRVTNLVRKAKRAYFEKLVSNKNNVAQVWRALNVLSCKSRRNHNQNHNYSAEDFNSHFLSTVEDIRNKNTTPDLPEDECTDRLVSFCRRKLRASDAFSIPLLSPGQVFSMINKLDNKKSMGTDNITVHILKISIPYVLDSLTTVYNRCIQENIFPDCFKDAKVVPLPKCKDVSSMDDFRPISILSILSKPLEKHVQNNLLKYMEEKYLFHNLQSGFRPKHSCHTALIRMCDSWIQAIDEQKLVGAVFLDLRKAFDMVDHHLLLKKISHYVQDDNTVLFLKSYLQNRTQSTFVNGSLSTKEYVHFGVPQGSILGPILFCMFINDLPLNICDPCVSLDLFADDTTISTCAKSVCEIQHALQDSLSNVSRWCMLNRMVLNPKKSKSMILATRQKHQRQPLKFSLKLGSTNIDQVNEHCVLGAIIDNKLSWIPHISSISQKVSRNTTLLSKLWHFVSDTALKVFFDAHCLSHINYSSTLWGKAEDVQIQKLDRLHRRGARIMQRDQSLSTDEKYVCLNILPLRDQLKYNCCILMFKQHQSFVPSYLKDLFPSEPNSRTGNYKPPNTRLKNMSKKRFAVQGVSAWNSLPYHCKCCLKIGTFKKYVRKYLQSNPTS